MGSSATRLEDEESTQALIDAKDIVVIGFFQVSEWHGVPGFGSRAYWPSWFYKRGPLRTCRMRMWLPSWPWPRMLWT